MASSKYRKLRCFRCNILIWEGTKCKPCYWKIRKETYRKSWEDRFLASFEKGAGCWLWKRSLRTHGYGCMLKDGKLRSAHKLSYELFKGPVPRSKFILHTCDIPRCVNPKHLYAGTQSQNLKDAYSRKRKSRYWGVNANHRLCTKKHPEGES